jgi:quinol monooxygenase YgiN
MIAVTARLRAKKGEEAALERELCDLARQVAENEPDCLLYRAARSKHDPQLYVVIERYRDDESLAAHANAEHYRNALPALMKRLDGHPEIALFEELEGDGGAESG